MTPFFRSYKGKSKSMYYNKHSETFIECCLVRYSEKRFFENVCLTFPHTVCDILCSLDYDHSRPFGGIFIGDGIWTHHLHKSLCLKPLQRLKFLSKCNAVFGLFPYSRSTYLVLHHKICSRPSSKSSLEY